MTGQTGIRVQVRYMPHHDHRIEVFDPATGRYLGPADLADQATAEQISAVRRVRAARTRRLRKDLEASQGERYAAATKPAPPQRLGVLSAAEADRELGGAAESDLAKLALPDLIPHSPPPAHWRTPSALAAGTAPLPLDSVPSVSAPAGPSADAPPVAVPELDTNPAGDA
jgi:putative transposase